TLYVNLAEAPMHAARVGAGYGTLDCFRVTGEYTDYNFLNGARRLDLNTRVSKIGIGRPLDGAPNLCPNAKKDVFSSRLNHEAASISGTAHAADDHDLHSACLGVQRVFADDRHRRHCLDNLAWAHAHAGDSHLLDGSWTYR